MDTKTTLFHTGDAESLIDNIYTVHQDAMREGHDIFEIGITKWNMNKIINYFDEKYGDQGGAGLITADNDDLMICGVRIKAID